MFKSRIIGLGHKRRTGKNVVGEMLSNQLYGRVRLVSFASKLKETSASLFGFAGLKSEQYYESAPKEKEVILPGYFLSPRDIYIQLGMKLREIDPQIWINNALNDIDNYDYTIITDVRFPNEADAIRKNGGTLIKITRDSAPVSVDPADNALNNYDIWDIVIENNGTLVDLESEVISIAETLNKLGGILDGFTKFVQ